MGKALAQTRLNNCPGRSGLDEKGRGLDPSGEVLQDFAMPFGQIGRIGDDRGALSEKMPHQCSCDGVNAAVFVKVISGVRKENLADLIA